MLIVARLEIYVKQKDKEGDAMKHICTRCGRISPDGNLWCQEQQCLAERKPIIFDAGDNIGDIHITRRITVLRTSAFYEGLREGEKIIVKMAHSDRISQDKLRYEAKLLAHLQSIRKHANFPTLITPYRGASVYDRPYGKIGFQNETKYFMLFEHIPGEFLRDVLRVSPFPWNRYAHYVVRGVSAGVLFMHENQKLHLNLSPDIVYIRTDMDGIPRPLLFDFGLDDPELIAHARTIIPPSYIPPELLVMPRASFQSDVYGLGLMMYEMLMGEPAYPFKSRYDKMIWDDVSKGKFIPINRTDLPNPEKPEYRDGNTVIMSAIQPNPMMRQENVAVFAHEMYHLFGDVPPERKRHFSWLNRRNAAIVGLVVVIIIVQLIVISAVFTGNTATT